MNVNKMGSGASSNKTKLTTIKLKQENFSGEDYKYKNSMKIYKIKDEPYCYIERDEFKLPADVLASFEQGNNFSRELEDVPVIKTKPTKQLR